MSTPDSDRLLGERLARMEATVNIMAEQVKQQSQNTAEFHKEQSREIRDLAVKLMNLEHSVVQLNTGQRLSDLESKVHDITKLKQRIIGYASGIAAIATIVFALIKDRILGFFGFGG